MTTHKTAQELNNELHKAARQVEVGALYAHYKDADMVYEVTGLAIWEATNEICVIYQAQYGNHFTFARALAVWQEEVEWRGQKVPRFIKI